MSKNMQLWEKYVSERELERYIGIYEGMLERYEASKDSSMKERIPSTSATLQRLYAEYERRTDGT